MVTVPKRFLVMRGRCNKVSIVGLVLVLTVLESLARPDKLNKIEFNPKNKSRILTNPPRLDFFGQEQHLNQPIAFQEEDEDSVLATSRLGETAECSQGHNYFCEQVPWYPYTHLKRVLNEYNMFKLFFGTDTAQSEVTHRIGMEDEKYVCRSVVQTIFPRMGLTKDEKWKLIINQGKQDGFVQGIQVELCKFEGSDCDIPANLPVGYKATCKQKFVYRRLLSVNSSGVPEPDTFKIPSACCCAYKQDHDHLLRRIA